MAGGGRPLLPGILGQIEIADFKSIFPRSDLAVTLSEKVQLTLIGSPLRALQLA